MNRYAGDMDDYLKLGIVRALSPGYYGLSVRTRGVFPSMEVSEHRRLARRYQTFAEIEAKGRSSLYEEITRAVACDQWTLRFLAGLPVEKQQPNLLLAAVRHVCGTARNAHEFLAMLASHQDEVATVMRARSTQTNEPGRCATLLPMLAALPQPLALLEVGASAGLCLLLDRYGYAYGDHCIAPKSVGPPVPPIFACRMSKNTPLPKAVPHIIWRAGLDLNPVNLHDDEQTNWLETLVWPEEEDRLANLRAALAVARDDPPLVIRGDLCSDLSALASQAPKGATLVVFHSAVLAYVARTVRLRFQQAVRAIGAVWIANEAPQVITDIVRVPALPHPSGDFLLAVDGRPVAWTDPHGRSIEWIG
jgi:hypothetical protein